MGQCYRYAPLVLQLPGKDGAQRLARWRAPPHRSYPFSRPPLRELLIVARACSLFDSARTRPLPSAARRKSRRRSGRRAARFAPAPQTAQPLAAPGDLRRQLLLYTSACPVTRQSSCADARQEGCRGCRPSVSASKPPCPSVSRVRKFDVSRREKIRRQHGSLNGAL